MELQILHWFESLHNPVTDPIMYGITTLGNLGWFWVLLSLVFIIFVKGEYKKVGFSMTFALFLSVIMCNLVMKNIFHRPRPFWTDPTFQNLYNVFDGIKDWSFPSGHTSASFAAAVAIFAWKKKDGIWALVLAGLISLSRLYLTVHYPTDVLTSLILGCIYGYLGYLFMKLWINKSDKAKRVFVDNKPYKSLFGK